MSALVRGLWISLFVWAPVLARADTSISVDTTHPGVLISPSFLGINYVAQFVNRDYPQSQSSAGLKELGVGLVRFPGGMPADFYDWQCPYYVPDAGTPCPASPLIPSWSWTSTQDLWNTFLAPLQSQGVSVLVQTNAFGSSGAVYPNSTLVADLPNPPGKSYAVDSAANAAAWAADNLTRGILARYEVGNEPDVLWRTATPSDPHYQAYLTTFNAQADAIHAAANGAKVYGPALSPFSWPNKGFVEAFLSACGSHADGLSVHYYPGATPSSCSQAPWPALAGTAQQWAAAGGPWQYLQTAMTQTLGHTLPVAITEFHTGGAGGCPLGSAAYQPAWNPTSGAALITVDVLAAFAQSGVETAEYFDVHNGAANIWALGLFYQQGESKPYETPTPTFYALSLWAHWGRQMVQTTVSGDPSTQVSAYGTRKPDGTVQVLALNKTALPQPVSVSIVGPSLPRTGVAKYVVQSAGDWSSTDVFYNGVPNPDFRQPLPAPTVTSLSGGGTSVTLPAYSVTVLDFGVAGPPDAGMDGGADAGIDAGIARDGSTAAGDAGDADAGLFNRPTGAGCGCHASNAFPGFALGALLLLAGLRRRSSSQGTLSAGSSSACSEKRRSISLRTKRSISSAVE